MVNYNLYIGVLGMLLLLTAFALNLLKVKSQDSLTYIVMNVLGGGISAYYAVTLEAVPFVILESVWTAFALYKLVTVKRQVKNG